MHLPLDVERRDREADILRDDEIDDAGQAGLGIDLDLGGVAMKRGRVEGGEEAAG